VIIHGTPEHVIEQIHTLRATAGLNYLLCARSATAPSPY
jgi:hypothetical protein